MKTSAAGVKFIADFEGFVNGVEPDPVGYCTAYYGHLVRYGPCTAADRARYPAIGATAGLKYLALDLQPYEAAVNRNVKVPLTQGMFDALASFTFNEGTGALAGSTLLRKLNAKDYVGAAGEFAKWNKAGGHVLAGLTRRRAAERKLFLSKSALPHDDYSVLSDTERAWVSKLFYHRRQMRIQEKGGRGPRYYKNLAWARWYKSKLVGRERELLVDLAHGDGGIHHRHERLVIIHAVVTNGARVA